MSFVQSGTLYSLGNPTKTVFLASEPNKITVELVALVQLYKGNAIKLDPTTGSAAIWAIADGRDKLFGYCSGDAAIGTLVTVFTRAFAVVYGISTAAIQAGPVAPQGYDNSTEIEGCVGYDTWANSSTEQQITGWTTTPAAAADDLIIIYLMD